MNRRIFLKNSAIGIAAGALVPTSAFSLQPIKKIDNLGVALFTLPQSLSSDFEGTLKMIADIGYKELEFYGPYDFSHDSAKENWKPAAKALGFSGSGYFGHKPKETREILDRYGLTAPSIHIDLPTLQNNMEKVAEAAHIVGHKYVGIAMIPEDMRQTLDDYKETIEIFNKVGESAKKNGLTFFYHNHGYGHQPMEGTVPFQLILDETDVDLVKMELDVFWFTAAGKNPVEVLAQNPGRFELLHVKDMREKKTFSGDGGDMQQWMGLFPYLADAGTGVLDLEGILTQAKKSGAKHFFLEKDMTPEPKQALQISYDHLANLDLKAK